MDISESYIQGLKAQEAKDLCSELLQKLRDKERAPISPGELQIKELELQIEQQRSRQAEAESCAEQVRQEHARVVEQVESAQEALSIQFERATREHVLIEKEPERIACAVEARQSAGPEQHRTSRGAIATSGKHPACGFP